MTEQRFWKTDIVILTPYDPSEVELSDLAREATDGRAICTLQDARPITRDEAAASSAGFFGLEADEPDESPANGMSVAERDAAVRAAAANLASAKEAVADICNENRVELERATHDVDDPEIAAACHQIVVALTRWSAATSRFLQAANDKDDA